MASLPARTATTSSKYPPIPSLPRSGQNRNGRPPADVKRCAALRGLSRLAPTRRPTAHGGHAVSRASSATPSPQRPPSTLCPPSAISGSAAAHHAARTPLGPTPPGALARFPPQLPPPSRPCPEMP
eukprot:2821863-Rhodomonas_salina.1